MLLCLHSFHLNLFHTKCRVKINVFLKEHSMPAQSSIFLLSVMRISNKSFLCTLSWPPLGALANLLSLQVSEQISSQRKATSTFKNNSGHLVRGCHCISFLQEILEPSCKQQLGNYLFSSGLPGRNEVGKLPYLCH